LVPLSNGLSVKTIKATSEKVAAAPDLGKEIYLLEKSKLTIRRPVSYAEYKFCLTDSAMLSGKRGERTERYLTPDSGGSAYGPHCGEGDMQVQFHEARHSDHTHSGSIPIFVIYQRRIGGRTDLF
jgi:hypothetical protein